ncbi:TetR/AcrR family transcriptional regulator [Mesorhizobium sp. M2D.F.Ca.ET.185.01.1.1]|uniref:TetR/AcrR family transcriptional regulator n=1 Tax=unclassified Mesorhizobium TaxID=325217 RepID=UPI000FCB3867|nr:MULTISPECIES: TetR/AcrR family transcriptional regulator [unclassified Mesorhizobium]TGP79509.1 TetR/AcrR family transcriptional regulator [bacterium M00.F.Ca.ET.227.01.1.1]TGQ01127.1 TetR/AcrR family transcriptional regulator [bacterium M00.F.Ca.ET.221.01.1.1]TGQ03105.1 TetR/AcrR family transcriptional regulator [bacterium M00.F.Ca.ET.222.01.1.1]TGU12626.1 TetR/AcrR family transcriptional regulator [bacterium M00.F.Ca.ET.163.01.1.1]TGU34594.1 TetR/AcrR family transcriptional regulator [bac
MTTEATRDAPAQKPLRADAQRNREKLVEVAARAFAADGVDASLEEIAKRAGVGIGTLYRHFPTREHLVEVVYRREVEGLCHAAEDLAREHPADVALELWMQRFVDYIATKRGLATSLRLLLTTNSTLFSDTSGRVSGAMRSLVEAAAASGKIRADVDSSDVMHALGGIYSAPNTPDWRERSGRLVKLLMDGLRFGATKAG